MPDYRKVKIGEKHIIKQGYTHLSKITKTVIAKSGDRVTIIDNMADGRILCKTSKGFYFNMSSLNIQ